MNRFMTLLVAICMASALVSTARADDAGTVNQSGSYTYTYVKQDGDRTKIKIRQIDPRKYDKLRDHLTAKVDRINAKFLVRSNPFRQPGWSNGGANSVTLDQSGNANLASATQQGSNDSIAINQDGTANAAYAVQQGDNLRAVANQSGDHNITFIQQRNRRAPSRPQVTPADMQMLNILFLQQQPQERAAQERPVDQP
ncbi:MAG: hypothetical protein ISS15_13980 [Alphaproteobacteria bacterium]|nr:hypothetical protein [Alphaproteobacteria bacterium]